MKRCLRAPNAATQVFFLRGVTNEAKEKRLSYFNHIICSRHGDVEGKLSISSCAADSVPSDVSLCFVTADLSQLTHFEDLLMLQPP